MPYSRGFYNILICLFLLDVIPICIDLFYLQFILNLYLGRNDLLCWDTNSITTQNEGGYGSLFWDPNYFVAQKGVAEILL